MIKKAEILLEEVPTLKKWINECREPGEIKQLGDVLLIANAAGGIDAAIVKDRSLEVMEAEEIAFEWDEIYWTSYDDTYIIRLVNAVTGKSIGSRPSSKPCCK